MGTEHSGDDLHWRSLLDRAQKALNAFETRQLSNVDVLLTLLQSAGDLELDLRQELQSEVADRRDDEAAKTPDGVILPKRLGRYEGLIHCSEVSGGQSQLLRGVDAGGVFSPVAVKIYGLTELSDGKSPRMSARVSATLEVALAGCTADLPGFVPVYECGMWRGCPYIVMQWMSGGSLRDVLKVERCFPPTDAAAIMLVIVEALKVLHHELRTYHLDVKPGNILLDSNRQPHLADFGAARYFTDVPPLQPPVTPLYAAPEYLKDSTNLHSHLDIYSAGATLYELLVGRPPFVPQWRSGPSSGDLGHLQLIKTCESYSRLPKTVPKELRNLCAAALVGDPVLRKERIPSVDDFASALNAYLRKSRAASPYGDSAHIPGIQRSAQRVSKPICIWLEYLARGIGSLRQTAFIGYSRQRTRVLTLWRGFRTTLRQIICRPNAPRMVKPPGFVRRLRRLVEVNAVRIVSASALVVLVTLVHFFAIERSRTAISAARGTLSTPVPKKSTLMQESLANARFWLSWDPFPFGKRRRTLFDEVSALETTGTRAFPDISTIRLFDRMPVRFDASWQVALHKEGNLVAIGAQSHPVVWSSGDAPELPKGNIAEGPRPMVAYTPDGKWLIYFREHGEIEVWDVHAKEMLHKWVPDGTVSIVAWGFSSEGELEVCDSEGVLRCFALPNLVKKIQLTLTHQRRITAAAYDDSLRRWVLGDTNGGVSVHSKQSQEEEPPRDFGPSAVDALAWLPDKNGLAVGTRNGKLKWGPWSENQFWNEVLVHEVGVDSIVCSSNGRWIMAGCRDSPFQLWDINSGELLIGGRDKSDPVSALSMVGNRVACAGCGYIALYDLREEQGIRHLRGHKAPIEQIAWSRDRKWAATLDAAHEIRAWAIPNGRMVDVFLGPTGDFWAPNSGFNISHDGRYVALARGGGSEVVIRDVKQKKFLGRWSIPGLGFHRIAALSNTEFVLVSEELRATNDGHEVRDTVKRQLSLSGLSPAQVIRKSPALDDGAEFGDLAVLLSRDGTKYAWLGPRTPPQRRRFEIWDIAKLQRDINYAVANDSVHPEPWMRMSEDGHAAWLSDVHGQLFSIDVPMKSRRNITADAYMDGESPDGTWHVDGDISRYAALWKKGVENPILLDADATENSRRKQYSFSPNNRHLLYGSTTGRLTLVDLETFETRMK